MLHSRLPDMQSSKKTGSRSPANSLTLVKRAMTAFLAIRESIVDGSIPLDANTSSRGLAAPKGFDLAPPDTGDPGPADCPVDFGFNYDMQAGQKDKTDD